MSAQHPDPLLPRPDRGQGIALATLGARLGAGCTGRNVTISGITANSAQVRPGDLFAAVPGRSGHGARFIPEALTDGALAVLTDPAGAARAPAGTALLTVPDVRAALGPAAAIVYGDPSQRLCLLGVTGTSGKTTTTYLIRGGLAAAGVTSGLIGTVGTLIGQQASYTGFTTPEAPELQALLAVMAQQGVRAVAMEVSSHALAQGRVDGLSFAVGAFTNLSQDHLDFHNDMERYFAAKARLFDGRASRAVIMVDDEWGRRLAAEAGRPGADAVPRPGRASADCGREVIRVASTDPAADWYATDLAVTPSGASTFIAHGPGVRVACGCAVPGSYNVANALLALAVLDAAGYPAQQVAPGIAAATVPGRMERIEAGQSFLAVVDYSHKPAAVHGALRALRPLTAGKMIIVLGCGGDRDRGKRPQMGEIAASGADVLIVTDDNPRSEDPAAIRAAMLAGALAVPAARRGEVTEIGDRAAAIRAAVAAARPGDTVLVAGKGHEQGQEVGGRVLPFDDRAILRAALAGSPA